jgi:hypothetical protein
VLKPLAAALAAAAWLVPAAKPPPADYLIGWDATASVPAEHYAHYREVVRALLETVRAEDRLVLLELGRSASARPGTRIPDVVRVRGRVTRMRRAVSEFYTGVMELPQQEQRLGYTDLGAVFSHAARRIESDARHGRERAVVIALLTDGEATGTQTAPSEGWAGPGDAEWELVLFCIDPDAQRRVLALAEQWGFDDPSRVHALGTDFQEELDQLVGLLGRGKNDSLLRALEGAERAHAPDPVQAGR